MMKLPAAAEPSTRLPTDTGCFDVEVTVGWVPGGGVGAATSDDGSILSGFALVGDADEAAVDLVRIAEDRDAEGDGTACGTTDDAAGVGAGELGGGGNGDELQPLNATTQPDNQTIMRE